MNICFIYLFIYLCIHVYRYVYVYVCMYICIYIYTYTCVYREIYIYVCTHTHTSRMASPRSMNLKAGRPSYTITYTILLLTVLQ